MPPAKHQNTQQIMFNHSKKHYFWDRFQSNQRFSLLRTCEKKENSAIVMFQRSTLRAQCYLTPCHLSLTLV